MQFLMDECKTKNHQLVLATHSPVLIEDLPETAIKVLDVDTSTHRVTLRSQDSTRETAFATIEHRFPRKTVIVEDILAAEIVRTALRKDGAAHLSSVDIKPMPGGLGYLRSTFLPSSALEGRSNVVLLLDGDARPATPTRAAAAVPQIELDDEVKGLLGVTTLAKHVPMNSSGVTEQDLRTILSWAEHHVRYLPGMTPEAWLMSASKLPKPISGAKSWWCDQTAKQLGKLPTEPVSATEILECQKRYLASLPESEPGLAAIRQHIAHFLQVSG